MKVLHIEAGRSIYGGARQVLYIMEGLQKRGITNLLACPIDADIAQAAKEDAQVYPIKMNGDIDIGMVGRLKQLIVETTPDLVHIHSRRGADLYGGIAARKTKVPSVLSRRVDNPEKKWWAQTKYKMFNHVVAISEGIRQVLIHEGVSPDHVSCVRSAVDATPYLHTVDRNSFAQEFQIPPDALVIGVVAQLIERKGHRYLIEAMPEILEQHPNVQVLFFGKGALAESLKQLIAQKHLQMHIHLAGFRTDLAQWIGGLDLLVHPADMEGLGVSLLQASAAAVPIIASNAGGLPEAVADGISGELFPPGDVKTLAQKINKFLISKELREQYGQAGRNRIIQEFSIDAMVEGNLAIYHQILKS